jgi:hypothetical protein
MILHQLQGREFQRMCGFGPEDQFYSKNIEIDQSYAKSLLALISRLHHNSIP